uniref:Uncharacterized protein n=1 Tax=Pelusios castaneus TaxID=367368 RepID=A0A8C8RTJ2_9SAUR
MWGQEDPVLHNICSDWDTREYIKVVTLSIKKIADFPTSLGQCGRSPLLPSEVHLSLIKGVCLYD